MRAMQNRRQKIAQAVFLKNYLGTVPLSGNLSLEARTGTLQLFSIYFKVLNGSSFLDQQVRAKEGNSPVKHVSVHQEKPSALRQTFLLIHTF